MLKSTAMLIDEFSNYSDPFGKIRRLIADGKLHQLTKAIYETDGTLPGHLFAPVIYGPSYLSFDYALSKYDLIPEFAHEYTSATFGKGKKKYYHNDFGDYSYRDVPKEVYPFETYLMTENGYTYSIAGPEKALCDKLYTLSPVSNIQAFKCLLFDDLRVDEEALGRLDSYIVRDLSELYRSTNVKFLARYYGGKTK